MFTRLAPQDRKTQLSALVLKRGPSMQTANPLLWCSMQRSSAVETRIWKEESAVASPYLPEGFVVGRVHLDVADTGELLPAAVEEGAVPFGGPVAKMTLFRTRAYLSKTESGNTSWPGLTSSWREPQAVEEIITVAPEKTFIRLKGPLPR